MKLLVLADLHLDDWSDDEGRERLGETIAGVGKDAEALIIAGDLVEAAIVRWPAAIRWLGRFFPTERTFLIPGNHDYYRAPFDGADAALEKRCRGAGCEFAQCRSLTLGSTRILMTTLWTDMRLFEATLGAQAPQEAMAVARDLMPDYGEGGIMIGAPARRLQPEDTVAVHERQMQWLKTVLRNPWRGKTVVITHHAPSPSAAGSLTPLSPCFTSDLDEEIDNFQPTAWFFGHTHRSAEVRAVGGTLLRNVSLGYEYELRPAALEARVRNGLIDLDLL